MSMGLKFEQITVEQFLWDTIANPKATRKYVATAYAMALTSREVIPWRGVNQAILERWSIAGLRFIKDLAWRKVCAEREGLSGAGVSEACICEDVAEDCRHETDGSVCPDCGANRACSIHGLTVLGRCPHGVDLDREFCPHGCRV